MYKPTSFKFHQNIRTQFMQKLIIGHRLDVRTPVLYLLRYLATGW